MAAEVRKITHGVDDKITSVDDTQKGVRDGAMNVKDAHEDFGARVTDSTSVTSNQSSTVLTPVCFICSGLPIATEFRDLTGS